MPTYVCVKGVFDTITAASISCVESGSVCLWGHCGVRHNGGGSDSGLRQERTSQDSLLGRDSVQKVGRNHRRDERIEEEGQAVGRQGGFVSVEGEEDAICS